MNVFKPLLDSINKYENIKDRDLFFRKMVEERLILCLNTYNKELKNKTISILGNKKALKNLKEINKNEK